MAVILTAGQGWAQEKSAQSFENIKSLEGKWEGVNPQGTPVLVTYEVVSAGSAVIEMLQPQGEPSMITVYHMDHGKVMMTHFCSAGNQPRMSASSMAEGNQISFEFVNATNLKSESDGHMHALTFVFKDQNAIEQKWTFRQGGEDKTSVFKLTRRS